MQFVTLFLFLTLFVPSILSARVIRVPDDYQSIQTAIDSSANGDTVLIAPARYTENINFNGRNITVASRFLTTRDKSFIERTIIDGNAQTRVAAFLRNENENARLIGLTLTNGRTNYGGGVYISGASPTLSYLIIRQNTATNNAGGIYSTNNSAPRIDHCTIVNNTAAANGGSVWTYNNGTITISNSIFYFNTPAATQDAPLTVSYTDIEGGHAGDNNINEDPRFIDRNNDDYNLDERSPCVDTGNPNAPRDPDGSRSDMGALAWTHFPLIRVAPPEVDFGQVTLGHSVNSAVQVGNVGRAMLEIASISITPDDVPFEITAGGDGVELIPGDAVDVVIRFHPQEAGEYSAMLNIVSNDPENGNLVADLLGVGIPPQPKMRLDTTRVDFGIVPLLQRRDIALNISNTGEADLNLINASIADDQDGWFGVQFAQDFIVQAGESRDLTLTFRPAGFGEREAQLVLTSNDPDSAVWHIPLTAIGGRPEAHYEFTNNTGYNHSILVLAAVIDDEDLPFGSEIGVFSPAGLCCGAEFWLGERIGMAAWGDNDMTEEIDGMRDGEAFTFRFWDIAAEEELEAEPEFVNGDRQYVNNGISVMNLTASRNGNEEPPAGFWVRLEQNWNLISAPAMPVVRDVRALWRPVVQRGSISIIKDHFGRFYVPALDFSNMQPWDYRFGYQVKALRVDSLFIAGEIAAEDTRVPLREGWSFVAYFPSRNIDAPTAFANIRDDLNIAKDGSGRFYVPRLNFNNMLPLQRGLGYQVKMARAVDLTWNIPRRIAAETNPIETHPPVHFMQTAPTDRNMSLLLNLNFGIWNLECLEMGIFTQSGLCVGASSSSSSSSSLIGLAVWGDDPTTEIIDGLQEGERFIVRLWDGFQGRDLNVTWLEGSGVFKADELAVAEIGLAEMPLQFVMLEAHPNPFNSSCILRYELPAEAEARISILDLTGREINRLSDGFQEAGWHSLIFQADNLPSGIYIAQLKVEKHDYRTKLILVR